MVYVCKISKHGRQKRLTLPKSFIKEHDLEDAEFLVIDDRDRQKITIGRLIYGGKEKSKAQ